MLRSYLIKLRDGVVERPQFMYMRVAIAINLQDIPAVLSTYNALSRQLYTHATPTLFNAGCHMKTYSSCYLYQPDASTTISLLSSALDLNNLWASDGGIGLSLATVPGRRYEADCSLRASVNSAVYSERPRKQAGVMPLLKVYDAHAHYMMNSRERRPSAVTAYLPIWHSDILPFLRCRSGRSPEVDRVRHVFPVLWVPDAL